MFETLNNQIEQPDNNMRAMIELIKRVGNSIKEVVAILAQLLSILPPQQRAHSLPIYHNQTPQMSMVTPPR